MRVGADGRAPHIEKSGSPWIDWVDPYEPDSPTPASPLPEP
jgi:hypothetical protein